MNTPLTVLISDDGTSASADDNMGFALLPMLLRYSQEELASTALRR